MKHYVRLDVSTKETSVCVVDDAGNKIAVLLHCIWVDGTTFGWGNEKMA